MINLLDGEVEAQLRDSVRSLLARRAPARQTIERLDSGPDDALWRTLAADMGLAGMAVPEHLGGGGGTLVQAAVVLEELGRAVAPVPFLSSAVVATAALVAGGEAELLAKLVTGERVAVLAVPLSSATPVVAATVEGGTLHGRATSVADALAADVLLVPAADGLYAVEAGSDGVARTPVVSLDPTRPLADVAFDGAAGRRIADGSAVTAALTTGAALLASEQLGIAEWCLETTVEYVKTRHQFGRPVGSFQALKHRLADLWADLTQARAVARYAAACAASGDDDLPVAAALAQAYCSPFAVRAAEECVQMHGGIGFTWEHPAHLYLKRAKADAIAYGTADRHRQLLAGLVDLPP